jgi:alpha-1,2-mannosyltransferase
MAKVTHSASGNLVRRMALFFGCAMLFEVLMIAVVPRFRGWSVLHTARECAAGRVLTDSWSYMAQAAAALQRSPANLYERLFFVRHVRFIYPPVSLLLFRFWQSAGRVGVAPFTWLKITLYLCFFGTWLVASEYFFQAALVAGRELSRSERWQVRLILAALLVTFLPLINALFLGQVQTIINLLAMASVLLWWNRRRVAPGILLGLCCWLKPQMALFLLWGLLRRQWSFAVSLGVVLAAGVGVSIAVFGLHNTLEYGAVLHYLSLRGDSLYTNQSLNGLLHRLMHVGSPARVVGGYPPFNRTIWLATWISSAALLVLALLVPPLRQIEGSATDFLIFAMASVMASPIAWEHHYGVFFLAVLLLMPQALLRGRQFFLLLGLYLLMSGTWAPLPKLLLLTPWTFTISHLYYGALGLFAWLLLAPPRQQPEAAPASVDGIETGSRTGHLS